MTQSKTPEYLNNQIDTFLDCFDRFDERICARIDDDAYVCVADRIALFAIFISRVEA